MKLKDVLHPICGLRSSSISSILSFSFSLSCRPNSRLNLTCSLNLHLLENSSSSTAQLVGVASLMQQLHLMRLALSVRAFVLPPLVSIAGCRRPESLEYGSAVSQNPRIRYGCWLPMLLPQINWWPMTFTVSILWVHLFRKKATLMRLTPDYGRGFKNTYKQNVKKVRLCVRFSRRAERDIFTLLVNGK